jgi:hypothetical protein
MSLGARDMPAFETCREIVRSTCSGHQAPTALWRRRMAHVQPGWYLHSMSPRHTIRTWRDRLLRRTNGADPIERLSRAELEGRADDVARALGVSRQRAFEMLDRGELKGSIAEPELQMVRDLLGASASHA